MREFVSKEIAFYNKMMNLGTIIRESFGTMKDAKHSLAKASEAFITSLETDFPATIYTVCRMSTKITSPENSSLEMCKFCRSKNDMTNVDECSALSALQVSHHLSGSSSQPLQNNLCYTCQNIFK